MIRIALALVLLLGIGSCAHRGGSKSTSVDSGVSASSAPKATTAAPATPKAMPTASPAPLPAKAVSTAPAPQASKVHKLPSGLVYEDLVVGNGKMADPGLTVVIHYTGWLTDGFKFDSSLDRNQPIEFAIGDGQMIRGLDEGIKGMRIGGKRKLTVPPDMAYGAAGRSGVIPPNATLVFEVQLLNVK